MRNAGSPGLRTLILVSVAIVVVAVLIARSYYRNVNSAVDPRIVEARELYSGYDRVARSGDFNQVFDLLSRIEKVYQSVPQYRDAFELGVIENNRAAAVITIALYQDSIPAQKDPLFGLEPDSILSLARYHVLRAIQIYEAWNQTYEGLSPAEISLIIRPGFTDGLSSYPQEQIDRFIERRTKEILESTDENDRRLSVCHSNLGVIYRLEGTYRKAVEQYELALALWDRNLDAENNLNKLLNRPVKERNIIQKLFPPEK
jgi:tetratricopeptide (TPR) repeat protein